MIKPVFYLLAALLGFLGVVFVAGSQGQILRIVVGIVLLAAAGGMVYLARMQTPEVKTTVTQKIDLSGDVNLEQIRCKSCGAALSKKSISVNAGAVMVNCEYCGAAYQIEEEVKW
jgi:zinc transporter ZupT